MGTIWINLKTLKLSDIIQTRKVHIVWLHLYDSRGKGEKKTMVTISTVVVRD